MDSAKEEGQKEMIVRLPPKFEMGNGEFVC